jgi:hypothetical protein
MNTQNEGSGANRQSRRIDGYGGDYGSGRGFRPIESGVMYE